MFRSRILGLFLPLLVACGAESPTDGGDPNVAPSNPATPSDPAKPANPSTSSDPAKPADPAPVTVAVVTWAGAPAADIEVVFHDATGAVTSTVKTDAKGQAASSGATTPAMVTAMLAGTKSKHLVTWTSVAAGDVLKVKNVKWGHDDVGTYDVKFGAVPNATMYTGNIGQCIGSQKDAVNAMSMGVSPYCVGGGQGNAALVRTTVNGVMRTAFAKDLAPAVGPAPMAVNVGAWQLASTVTVTATNMPKLDEPTYLIFDEVAGTTRFENPAHVAVDTPAAVKVAPGLADGYQMTAIIFPPAGGIFSVMKHAAPGPQQTLDFANPLPRIADRNADYARPERPIVTWTPASSLAATDGGIVTLRWFAENEPRGWSFFVAPTATKVEAPVMPASAAAWLPKPGDGEQAGPKISFVQSDAFEGARGLRANGAVMVPLGEAYDWAYGMSLRNMTLPVNTSLKATHSN